VLDEWEFHNARIEFMMSKPEDSRSKTLYPMIQIRFKMRRHWKPYFWNIIFFMMAIAFLSLTCFALVPDPNFSGDRIGLAITLILTAVAFQFIILDQLPFVSYLTILHKYVITSFVYIAGIAIESAADGYYFHPDHRIPDDVFFWIFVAVYIIYNAWFLRIVVERRHEETKKLTRNSEELRKYDIEKDGISDKIKWFDAKAGFYEKPHGPVVDSLSKQIAKIKTDHVGKFFWELVKTVFTYNCCKKKSTKANEIQQN